MVKLPAPGQNNFAAFFDARATEPQDYVCFLHAESRSIITYFELRLRAAWLARELEAQNIVRGGVCAVDMENGPALIYTLMAAAYGGFSVVLVNPRLTETEKLDRIDEIKKARGIDYLPILDEHTAASLTIDADSASEEERSRLSQWTRRGVASFDEHATAVVVFTSGTTGRSKAVPFTWGQLQSAARACNEKLCTEGEGIWQLVLPLHHIDGLQVVFRSMLNRTAFLLYREFDAKRVLADAKTYGVTHISVLDKMLQDMIEVDVTNAQPEAGAHASEENVVPLPSDTTEDPTEEIVQPTDQPDIQTEPEEAALADYECIVLCGERPNKVTVIRALGQHAPVFASYGMTETCSHMATARIEDTELILLEPHGGYEYAIVAPDSSGFGQLGVRGAAVLDGYLNAQATFTVDNYFLTGDQARVVDGKIEMAETVDNSFISGGENIYPAEIRDKILAFEGVTDAYVFGAPHPSWGKRPVAFVEAAAAASRPGFNGYYFADDMRNRLSTRLSHLYMPDQFVVMKEFPRTGIGKVGEGTLERAWDARIQVAKVEIWHIRLPLQTSFRNAKTKLRHRESIVLRVTDYAGRTGIGECCAFATDWYSPETVALDLPFIRESLAPLLVGRVLLHPDNAAELFENAPGASERPYACTAVEAALWDLYGKIRGRSIRYLIGGRDQVETPGAIDDLPEGCVLGGAVVGLGSHAEMIEAANRAAEAGYRCVKIKVQPGSDIEVVKAVRKAHPNLMIMLDADQSYKDNQLELLQELDEYHIECIEEPLDPSYTPTVGPTNLFDRLSRLQAKLRMRVCLDESWQTGDDLRESLENHPELRCVALKLGKFGSVAAALEFHTWAREKGIEVWPGGMYETGISKRLHAAFATLSGVNLPGDFYSSDDCFTVDICTPPFKVEGGVLKVNEEEYPAGLGCALNESILANVTEKYWVCE